MLVAQERDYKSGCLPETDDLSYILHIEKDECSRKLSRLSQSGFLDEHDGFYVIHDWDEWKCKKDPTGAERKRKQRAKHKTEKEVTNNNEEITDDKIEKCHGTSRDVTNVPKCHTTDTDTDTEADTEAKKGVSRMSRDTCPNRQIEKDDPDLDRISKLAEELTANPAWARWVYDQNKLGRPVHAIEEALHRCADQQKWSMQYAGGILRSMALDGYPAPEIRHSGTIPMVRERPKTEKQIEMEALAKRREEFKARRLAAGDVILPPEEIKEPSK